jgi:hypothetical protein
VGSRETAMTRFLRSIAQSRAALLLPAACAIFAQDNGRVHAAPADQLPTVAVSASCEAIVPVYCRGRFGFQMTSAGTWLVGPAPGGRSLAGHLREAERRALQSATARVLDSIPTSYVECHVRPAIPGVGESVTISTQARTVVLRGAGGWLDHDCAPGDATADARLFALADRLMRRYYPRPFG